MQLSESEVQTLKELEESLWRAETRFDVAHQEKVFAPDFVEFGRSGRVYSRSEMIISKVQEIRAELPLQNYTIRSLDDHTVQVTYISKVQYEELETANRSSIWSKTPDGWKLRFIRERLSTEPSLDGRKSAR